MTTITPKAVTGINLPDSKIAKQATELLLAHGTHKPHTTYGSINADICVCMIPGFKQTSFCDLILHSPWAE
jgi:hypothetical protein